MYNKFYYVFFSTVLIASSSVAAEEFDPAFLVDADGQRGGSVELGYFLSNNGLVPGEYIVDVYINNTLVEKDAKIFFLARKGKLIPDITQEQMKRWGIEPLSTGNKKDSLIDILPGSNFDFNVNKSLLLLNVPQKYMSAPDWLNTPSFLWDDGIPSLLFGYSYSGYEQKINGSQYDSQYMNLQSSLNLGGWRFRNDGYWIRNSSSGGEWHLNESYLRHDYGMLQGGQFTVGQTSTSGDIFDSFPFRGIQFYSVYLLFRLSTNMRHFDF